MIGWVQLSCGAAWRKYGQQQHEGVQHPLVSNPQVEWLIVHDWFLQQPRHTATTFERASHQLQQQRHSPPPPSCCMYVFPSGRTMSSMISVKPIQSGRILNCNSSRRAETWQALTTARSRDQFTIFAINTGTRPCLHLQWILSTLTISNDQASATQAREQSQLRGLLYKQYTHAGC